MLLRKRRRRAIKDRLGLSNAWQRWVADNLLRGVDDATLIATLTEQGVPAKRAAREIAAIHASPLLHAALRADADRRRLEMVASLRRAVLEVGAEPASVERRAGVSGDEFFERYYRGGEPVILTDVVPRWPAFGRWSPAYFKERFGALVVDYTDTREGDPDYDRNFAAHTRRTTLGALADRITSAGPTNDFYLVANNRVLEKPEFAGFFADLVMPEAYIDPARRHGAVCLWFGPGGTVTPLHHDTTNILFCQVVGRKVVKLIAPCETKLFETLDGVYSQLDPEAPDLRRFPWFSDVRVREVTLAPGDALFLPVGTFHHVRSLDPSISVSFTNFVRSNAFGWYAPGTIPRPR